MSKEILPKADDSLSVEMGKRLATAGVGGLVLGAVAWLLPFVTLPMLLVLAVVMGAMLYAR